MVAFVRVVETCIAAPNQWDAWDADGQYYYLRFRYGRGTVERLPGPDVTTWPLPYPSPEILVASWETEQRRAGIRDYSGVEDLDEFLRLLGMELAPGAEVIPWEHPPE